ncbi:MAG TPA: carbohydrate kinase family protein [Patescibacteria group bacterium]|nr:carbohydrate kinase family protein [Patescibacteria group bacterium]
MATNKNLLIAIGNIYLDNNIFNVDTGGETHLRVGKDYFAERSEKVLGGSAVNFAQQAKNLGLSMAFLGKIGNDDEGKEIKKLLKEKDIISDLVMTSQEDQTSIAFNTIFTGNGEFIGFHWGNASRNLDADQIDVTNPLFNRAIAVYFGGTAKQDKVLNKFPMLFQKIHDLGIKIIIDPNRFPVNEQKVKREILLDSFHYVECYLPNEDEIKQVTQKENLDAALEEVLQKGVKVIVVKMGAKGCRIKTKEIDLLVPGYKVIPTTTVGAGDSFNAGFITQYLEGEPLEVCAKFANACAAIKVGENNFANYADVEVFLENF